MQRSIFEKGYTRHQFKIKSLIRFCVCQQNLIKYASKYGALNLKVNLYKYRQTFENLPLSVSVMDSAKIFQNTTVK